MHDVRCQTSDVLYLTSYVLRLTSYILQARLGVVEVILRECGVRKG